MRIFKIVCLISLLLFSCHIGKKQVEYAEMSAKPIISFQSDSLILRTQNSKYHSALSIFKVEANVNRNNKSIIICAFEAANEPYKELFIVDLKEYNINNIAEYTLIWLNPDGSVVPLVIGAER